MPAPPIPNVPEEYINNCKFEVFRPFGSSSPFGLETGTLVDAMPCGRFNTGGNVQFTHILYTGPSCNIRHNWTRISGLHAINYSDGDEVRAYNHEGYSRFVVVFVTYIRDGTVNPDSPSGYKAVYLFLDSNVII